MNGNTLLFGLIAMLFAFAATAFIFGDFLYCVAFLIALAFVIAVADPREPRP